MYTHRRQPGVAAPVGLDLFEGAGAFRVAGALARQAVVRARPLPGPMHQSDKISHIDMGDDRIDTVISNIISLISHIDIQDDHIDMVDNYIDTLYPKSISHIPYRNPYRYLNDVRSPISISHIDLPIISCHSVGGALARRAVVRARPLAPSCMFVKSMHAYMCRGQCTLHWMAPYENENHIEKTRVLHELVPRLIHWQSLASTKFGHYCSHFAVVWAVNIEIGRT